VHVSPAPAGCCPVTAKLLPISSDIFPHRVDYWSCSHVLYQSPPPADNGSVNGLYSGFTEGRFRKKIIKNSPLGLLPPFFHCSTGDTFGYNVIEPFGTVLFRTGDSVALLTLGSENTPLCRATIKTSVCQYQINKVTSVGSNKQLN